MSNLRISQAAGVELVRPPKNSGGLSILKPQGQFKIEHYRKGKRINEYVFPNGIVDEGKNKLLDVMFHAVAAISTWYIGLIDLTGYSALADDDTYDDINQTGNGWDEFASYTDANNGGSGTTRPEWQEDGASGQSITNSTTSIYDITANGTVKGIFVAGGANAQAKSDHEAGNTLWATALFGSGDVSVLNGDQLKITYTVSA